MATDTAPTPHLRSALILKADRLYADSLRATVRNLCPGADVAVVHSVKEAQAAIAIGEIELILTGFDAVIDGDVLQLIADLTNGADRSRRVFVVGSQFEYRILAVLHSLPIRGVFDAASESPAQFKVALRSVINGERYWSRSVLDRLRTRPAHQAACHNLSTTEQLVLSVLGDGSDDHTAAEALGLSPATISTFRRKLHRKLSVQHRGELIRVAAQNGYVRFTPSGIVRPGFAMLAAECLARKRKRRATATAAVSAFLSAEAASAAKSKTA